jgi:hypothetical protein
LNGSWASKELGRVPSNGIGVKAEQRPR